MEVSGELAFHQRDCDYVLLEVEAVKQRVALFLFVCFCLRHSPEPLGSAVSEFV